MECLGHRTLIVLEKVLLRLLRICHVNACVESARGVAGPSNHLVGQEIKFLIIRFALFCPLNAWCA